MFKGKRTAPCARMAANRRRAVSGAVAEALESRRLLSLTVYIPTGGWAYVGWEQENPQDAANINVSLVNGTLTVNGVVHGTDIIGGEIEGTPCDDTITISGSGAGNPQWHIYGLAGDDTITGSGYSAGSLTMWGSDGDDLLVGGSKGDTLFGGYGDDTLIGNCGDDVLVGGPGNDVIDGGCGNDSVHGNE